MFSLDDLDYLRLRVFENRFNKKDIYLFISENGVKHFYRIERNNEKKQDKILIHREFYETDDELHERAKNLAGKVNEETAVIIAEDAGDTSFPGDISEKVKLALLFYSWESERQSEEKQVNQ
ncbi:MAG: hypothetical protein QW666_03825 [Candidatus Woesearchaeota archaeon]